METGPGLPAKGQKVQMGKLCGVLGWVFLVWFGCLMGCSVGFGYVCVFCGVVCYFGVFLLVG